MIFAVAQKGESEGVDVGKLAQCFPEVEERVPEKKSFGCFA